jgi:hypothetical protein
MFVLMETDEKPQVRDNWTGRYQLDSRRVFVLTSIQPKGVITTLRGSYLAAIANAYETQMNFDSVYLW